MMRRNIWTAEKVGLRTRAVLILLSKWLRSFRQRVVFPVPISPVITRQLLYTGVTRAQTKVIIIGDLKIIQKAIGLSVKHSSGLTDYLRTRLKINQNSGFVD